MPSEVKGHKDSDSIELYTCLVLALWMAETPLDH